MLGIMNTTHNKIKVWNYEHWHDVWNTGPEKFNVWEIFNLGNLVFIC